MFGVKAIDLKGLEEWKAAEKDFQLVDVRESVERESFNIGGDWIPLDEVVKQKDQVAQDKPVVFYCKRGIRSQVAIQKLKLNGHKGDFYNLKGGVYYLLP